MKALVHDGRVCQIEAETFPVAPGLMWVDCDETVTTSHTYVDGVFVAPVVPVVSHNDQIDAQIRALEASRPGYVRGIREFMLGMALIAKQQGGPDLMTTPGMQNVKALDDQIKALRAQRQ